MLLDMKLSLYWSVNISNRKQEGIVGLFDKGKLLSQIIRDVPYAVITLVCYEIFQQYLTRRHAAVGKDKAYVSNNNKIIKINNINKKLNDAICGSLAGGIGS